MMCKLHSATRIYNWLWRATLAICLSMTSIAIADERPAPFVKLSEVRGHLAISSCLPAGRAELSAVDDQGIQLNGFVLVEAGSSSHRVRIFRLQGNLTAARPIATETQRLASRFAIVLRPTTNPDHFALQIDAEHVADGATIHEQARLCRNCCGYTLEYTKDGEAMPVGRAVHLTGLMVQAEAAYRAFEELACTCCRPGFEFVPASPLSPSVVQEVVAADQARPGIAEIRHFHDLVGQLDSDEFSRREAATKALIDGGLSTSWCLVKIADKTLTAEQRHRLQVVRSAVPDLSTSRLPFEFPTATIRQLIDEPTVDWLTEVAASSDDNTRKWAQDKLTTRAARSAGAVGETQPVMP